MLKLHSSKLTWLAGKIPRSVLYEIRIFIHSCLRCYVSLECNSSPLRKKKPMVIEHLSFPCLYVCFQTPTPSKFYSLQSTIRKNKSSDARHTHVEGPEKSCKPILESRSRIHWNRVIEGHGMSEQIIPGLCKIYKSKNNHVQCIPLKVS